MQVTPQDITLVLCQIGLFVALFLVLKHWWFAPVSRIIHERAHRSEGALAEAREVRARAEALRAEHAAALEATRGEAQRELQEMLREAESEQRRVLEAAHHEAERTLADARDRIARDVEDARADLDGRVRELARQAAQAVLGRSVG